MWKPWDSMDFDTLQHFRMLISLADSLPHGERSKPITLWWTNKKQWKMAIEILDFPMKNGDFPVRKLLVHQRVLQYWKDPSSYTSYFRVLNSGVPGCQGARVLTYSQKMQAGHHCKSSHFLSPGNHHSHVSLSQTISKKYHQNIALQQNNSFKMLQR